MPPPDRSLLTLANYLATRNKCYFRIEQASREPPDVTRCMNAEGFGDPDEWLVAHTAARDYYRAHIPVASSGIRLAFIPDWDGKQRFDVEGCERASGQKRDVNSRLLPHKAFRMCMTALGYHVFRGSQGPV